MLFMIYLQNVFFYFIMLRICTYIIYRIYLYKIYEHAAPCIVGNHHAWPKQIVGRTAFDHNFLAQWPIGQ